VPDDIALTDAELAELSNAKARANLKIRVVGPSATRPAFPSCVGPAALGRATLRRAGRAPRHQQHPRQAMHLRTGVTHVTGSP